MSGKYKYIKKILPCVSMKSIKYNKKGEEGKKCSYILNQQQQQKQHYNEEA